MGDINKRIKLVVDQSKLTKTEFAKRIKVSQQHVSRLTLDGNPSERTICDIASEFNINEDWLRTGEGPMRIQTTRQEELSQFFGQLLHEDIPDRREIILSLSRMSPEWWKATADLILSAADAIKKNENPEPE